MLYLGHFSFSELWPSSEGADPWHGLFTCVVEARTIEAAFEKFRRLIRELTREHDVFENVTEIYLDTCVELHAMPRAGLMSFMSIREGEDVGGISAALLGAAPGSAVAYQFGREPHEHESDPQPMDPFLRLRRSQRPESKKMTRKPVGPPNRTIH